MKKVTYTLRNLFRISNIGTFVFFILNFVILLALFGGLFEDEGTGYLYLTLIYIGSVLLSFTPIGQGMLCLLCGARKMKRKDMRDKVLPLVAEVYEKAKEKTPLMPDRINVRVTYDPEPNAYAIGTHTICVSEGLLSMPDNEIQGVLAHEMGHLALQHTLIQSMIGGGNLIMTSLMLILEICKAFFGISGTASAIRGRDEGFIYAILAGFTFIFIAAWTKILTLFLMGSSRANEYEADAYASDLGYGYDLAEALDHITMGQPQSTFLQLLNSSHPEPADRIGRLQAMGAGYARY